MKKLMFAYCNECEDLVEFDTVKENVAEQYKGENISYSFTIGRCRCCGAEVATDIDYNSRKSEAKIKAYKKKKEIIDLEEISEILEKYDIGKEALADIAGFGKVTVKRYYEGVIPAKASSDVLYTILNDETFFIEAVKTNQSKLSTLAYRKIMNRYERLMEIGGSKIEQAANYIITQLGEVTPLALEKLLAFANGVNYALNDSCMFDDECQAWQHGPVYPYIYYKYKNYGYKPIDNGIHSSHGCLQSLISDDEIKVIDMVIKTFGVYSPKTLEMISHCQEPWLEKRIGYRADEAGKEVMDEASVKRYYIENELYSEENIIKYINNCIRG